MTTMTSPYVMEFSDISLGNLATVGGKNASLGELFRALKPKGVGVLDGFATTADAYRHLLATNGLEARLRAVFVRSTPRISPSCRAAARPRAPRSSRRRCRRICATRFWLPAIA